MTMHGDRIPVALAPLQPEEQWSAVYSYEALVLKTTRHYRVAIRVVADRMPVITKFDTSRTLWYVIIPSNVTRRTAPGPLSERFLGMKEETLRQSALPGVPQLSVPVGRVRHFEVKDDLWLAEDWNTVFVRIQPWEGEVAAYALSERLLALVSDGSLVGFYGDVEVRP